MGETMFKFAKIRVSDVPLFQGYAPLPKKPSLLQAWAGKGRKNAVPEGKLLLERCQSANRSFLPVSFWESTPAQWGCHPTISGMEQKPQPRFLPRVWQGSGLNNLTQPWRLALDVGFLAPKRHMHSLIVAPVQCSVLIDESGDGPGPPTLCQGFGAGLSFRGGELGCASLGVRWKSTATGKRRGDRQVCGGWKKKDTKNVVGRARKLIFKIRPISDAKEEVFSVLDEWCAWEMVFPMLAVKAALNMLSADGEWKRVIQVCKWMLAKGQGRTLGTYGLMIEAYDAMGRVEEMEELWRKVLEENLESMPRAMFSKMMKLYEDRNKYLKVLEVWGSMEAMGVKPDEGIVKRVTRAFVQVGVPSKAEELRQAYPLTNTEFRYVDGKKTKVRVGKPARNPTPHFSDGAETPAALRPEERHEGDPAGPMEEDERTAHSRGGPASVGLEPPQSSGPEAVLRKEPRRKEVCGVGLTRDASFGSEASAGSSSEVDSDPETGNRRGGVRGGRGGAAPGNAKGGYERAPMDGRERSREVAARGGPGDREGGPVEEGAVMMLGVDLRDLEAQGKAAEDKSERYWSELVKIGEGGSRVQRVRSGWKRGEGRPGVAERDEQEVQPRR